VYDGKCFPVWSLSQVSFKTSSNGFHGVSRVVLSTNCACLYEKFPKDFSKSICRELLNVFRYSFLSRPRLKVKTMLLNLTFIHCYVFLVSKYILIRQIVSLKQLCPIKSFLTFKNFNRVRRRLLGFLGHSLLDEDSYIYFADLGEASSHIYYNKTRLFSTENFHGRLLSIRVFSSDGHYGLIVSLRG